MFEMREPLVRQIIFAMENQNIRYLMDTERGVLVRPESVPEAQRPVDDLGMNPGGRYQPIPSWSSADGFQLMERFVDRIQHEAERDQLQEILLSGSRVFRRFKDALKENDALAQRFYHFKYREMRALILDWYDGLRELAGLDILERGVDEELDDLWRTNVSVERAHPVPVTIILELDRMASAETHRHLPEPARSFLRQRRRTRLPGPADAHSVVLTATTPMDDLCGFAWIAREQMPNGSLVCELLQLYVLEEYRGLGIGTALLDAAVEAAAEVGAAQLLLSVPPGEGPVRQALERRGAARHVELCALETGAGPGS